MLHTCFSFPVILWFVVTGSEAAWGPEIAGEGHEVKLVGLR